MLPQAAMPAVKPDTPKPKTPDCVNWMKKGKCAKKDSSCVFAHDPEKRGIQKRRLREAVHLRPLQEGEKAEKEKEERVLNHQNLMPVLQKRALEALAPRANRSRYAVKNGSSVVRANGEKSANFGILLHANSLPRVPARLETRVRFLTEPAQLLLTKRISPRQDLLSDCQLSTTHEI